MSRNAPPVPPKPKSNKSFTNLPAPVPKKQDVVLRDSGISADVSGTNESLDDNSVTSVTPKSVKKLAEQFILLAKNADSTKQKPKVPPKPISYNTNPKEDCDNIVACIETTHHCENIYDEVFVSNDDEGCYDQVYYEEVFDPVGPQNATEELLQNERKYVARLQEYVDTLIPIMYQPNLPMGLRFQKNSIFSNIEEIHAMHRDAFLPKIEQCGSCVQKIAEGFLEFIDSDRFYCYVLYALNKQKSESICDLNADFLQNIYSDLNKFLLEPIQRLPRYKLLLTEISKEASKTEDTSSLKSQAEALSQAEKKLSSLVELVDAAVGLSDIFPRTECDGIVGPHELSYHEDLPLALVLRPQLYKNAVQKDPVNLLYQGKFRRFVDLDIYDYGERRKYPSRIFIFEKLLLYTEFIKSKLEYRGHYFDSELNYSDESRTKLQLFCHQQGKQTIEVNASDTLNFNLLIECVHNMRVEYLNQMRETNAFEFIAEKTISLSTGVDETMVLHRQSEGETQWDIGKHVSSFVASHRKFCQVLQANYDFYLSGQSTDQQFHISSFKESFRKMYVLHNTFILHYLSDSISPRKVCELFLSYLDNNLLTTTYYEYLKDFKKAINTISIHRTPATFNNQIAPKVEDFVALCIDHLYEFSRFFEKLISRMSDDSSANISIDIELFRHLAVVQIGMDKLIRNVRQNYKLYQMDDRAVECGLVKYSEVITLQTEEGEDCCRLFLNERAAICVILQVIREHDKRVEKYVRIVFIDKFGGRGSPMKLRKSKKTEVQLNFVIDECKFKVFFKNHQEKDRFYHKYVQHFVLVK